jgi:hypothetical protein
MARYAVAGDLPRRCRRLTAGTDVGLADVDRRAPLLVLYAVSIGMSPISSGSRRVGSDRGRGARRWRRRREAVSALADRRAAPDRARAPTCWRRRMTAVTIDLMRSLSTVRPGPCATVRAIGITTIEPPCTRWRWPSSGSTAGRSSRHFRCDHRFRVRERRRAAPHALQRSADHPPRSGFLPWLVQRPSSLSDRHGSFRSDRWSPELASQQIISPLCERPPRSRRSFTSFLDAPFRASRRAAVSFPAAA